LLLVTRARFALGCRLLTAGRFFLLAAIAGLLLGVFGQIVLSGFGAGSFALIVGELAGLILRLAVALLCLILRGRRGGVAIALRTILFSAVCAGLAVALFTLILPVR
jgi:hypothetical protein